MVYRVIALSVGGIGNKVFRYGDRVSEANFPKERFQEILKGGFLEAIEEEKKIEDKMPLDKGIDESFMTSEKAAYDEITTKEIKEYLDEKGVSYKSNASKQELHGIYLLN